MGKPKTQNVGLLLQHKYSLNHILVLVKYIENTRGQENNTVSASALYTKLLKLRESAKDIISVPTILSYGEISQCKLVTKSAIWSYMFHRYTADRHCKLQCYTYLFCQQYLS